MPWISSPDRALAALADAALQGAWLTLAYVLVQRIAGDGELHLGLAELAGAALAGLLLARHGRALSRRRYAGLLVSITLAATFLGWIGPMLQSLGAGDLRAALLANPGGLLAGIAVIRGTAHADAASDGATVEGMLGPGLLGLAVFWMIATLIGLVALPALAGTALTASVAFVTATLLALGLARLAELRHEGMEQGDSRRWLGLLLGVTGLMLLVSLPLAAVLGVPLLAALTGVLGPFAPLLSAALLLLAVPFAFLAGWLVEVFTALGRLLGAHAAQNAVSSIAPGPVSLPPLLGGGGEASGPLLLLITLIGVVGVALIVARMLRRPALGHLVRPASEVRATELPTPHLVLPRLRRAHRRSLPRTAREAYLAALEALGRSPSTARQSAETPAEHARRLRASELGQPLARLAADYQLDAFGGRVLSEPEERRAIDRWRRLAKRR